MLLLLGGYVGSGWLVRRLQRPVQVESVVSVERRTFRGTLPTVALQRRLYDRRRLGWWSVLITAVYISHFIVPYVCSAWLRRHDRERWRRWNAEFSLVSAAGLVTYVVLPTAPPWMASDAGVIEPVERTSSDGFDVLCLDVLQRVLDTGQQRTNTVAAIPSVHAAHAALVPLFFWNDVPAPLRPLLAAYPVAMGAALVVTAEHYVVDVLLGYAYTVAAHAAVRAAFGPA